MSIRKLIRRIQLLISRQSPLVDILIKAKNQIDVIIRLRITNTIKFDQNGEKKIMDHVIPLSHTIVDIGANLGQFTDEILKTRKDTQELRIFLFEPSKKAFEILKDKWEDKSIDIFNVGLSDEKKTGKFYEKSIDHQTSSLFMPVNEMIYDEILVSIDRLDNYQSVIGEIDFCKIDTEGNDYYVLKGAENYLKNKKIRFLQFEYGPNWILSGSTLYRCIDYLRKLDYEVFLIRKDGLYGFNYKKWGEFFGYSNFFAIRNEDKALISNIITGKF